MDYGVELEDVYRPISLFRIDAAASVGDWKSTNDADALYKDYEGAPDSAFTIYVKNLFQLVHWLLYHHVLSELIQLCCLYLIL